MHRRVSHRDHKVEIVLPSVLGKRLRLDAKPLYSALLYRGRKRMTAQVGIIMGSQSDWPTMREAAEILDALGVPYDAQIVSAHRTPDRLWTYGKSAVDRGLAVIIAGAGGAAAGGAAQVTHLVERRRIAQAPDHRLRAPCAADGNLT